MSRRVAQVALLVRDYDEAADWFARALGFTKVEDTDLGGGKRWLRIAPATDAAFSLLLSKASTPEQVACIGRQHGGRVGFFLHTDDFARDLARLREAGAAIEGEPRNEAHGRVAIFADLYGNRWDLIQPHA